MAVLNEGSALDLDGEEMKVRLLPRNPLGDGRYVAPAEFYIMEFHCASTQADLGLIASGRTDGVTQQDAWIAQQIQRFARVPHHS